MQRKVSYKFITGGVDTTVASSTPVVITGVGTDAVGQGDVNFYDGTAATGVQVLTCLLSGPAQGYSTFAAGIVFPNGCTVSSANNVTVFYYTLK